MNVQDCGSCSRRDFVLSLASVMAALAVSDVSGLVVRDGVSYTVPTADGAQIDKDNAVMLVRWAGSLYAFSLSCPHQRTALRWDADDKIFRCPKHKSQFKPEGTLIDGKAKRGLDRYPLSVSGSTVTVDNSKLIKESDDRAAWLAAVVQL